MLSVRFMRAEGKMINYGCVSSKVLGAKLNEDISEKIFRLEKPEGVCLSM